MKRSASSVASHAPARSRLLDLWLAVTVVFASWGVELFVSPNGSDSFRLPKIILMRATAIVAAFLISLIILWRRERLSWAGRFKPELAALALIVLSALLSTLLSTHRASSLQTDGYLLSALVLFVASVIVGVLYRRVTLLLLVITAASVNAIAYLLQAFTDWTPFELVYYKVAHLSSTALLGNPDDVSVTLLAPTLAAVIIGLETSSRRHRVWAWAIASINVISILFSQTLTTNAALIFGLTIIVWRRSRKLGMAVVISASVAAVLVAQLYRPMHQRIAEAVEAIQTKQHNALLTGRVTPWLAATEMFIDHPVTGVGTGTFSWNYYEYKLRAERKYPRLLPHDLASWTSTRRVNFGEAHNEWLQVAAEMGAIGIAAMVIAFVLFWRRNRIGSADDDAGRIAVALTLPLLATLAVLCLAQFPLRLAAPSVTYAILAGLITAWRDDATA